jgi:ribosome maturation factor RimP
MEMKSAEEIRTELLDIVGPVCEDAGYELVDIRYLREQGGWVVRAFIDHLPGRAQGQAEGISFADCERISRELSAVLDVEDPIPHGYNLEVSSPGVDRPLRTAAHFRRFVGETARVVMARDQGGRKRFKGTILEVAPAEAGGDDGEASVTLEIEDGQRFELPVADIATARLVPDWDTLSRKPGPGAGGDAPNAPMGVV